jgi:hypothetical protein
LRVDHASTEGVLFGMREGVEAGVMVRALSLRAFRGCSLCNPTQGLRLSCILVPLRGYEIPSVVKDYVQQ